MQLQSIKSIRKLGIQNTLDFEVDHKDHNFYAEGIVVSNSHASGYGHLSATCAYLKANHPTEFFYSLLKNAKNESKPQEEISAISEELSRFGIKLVGPDLILSGEDFTIEDKNTIRMGLGNIKGVSDKALLKLKNFCHKHSNKFEIFRAANECGINIAVLGNLIMAGAMDRHINETRTLTVKEMQTWNLLTDREQEMVLSIGKKFSFNLVEIIKHLKEIQNGDTKPFFKASRLQTIRSKYSKYHEMYNQNSKNESLAHYIFEKKLLGFSYSQNLVDILNKDDSGFNVITIEEAMGCGVKEHVVIAGEITEVRTGTSKNKNKYIKLNVSDGTGSIAAMLMEKNFAENTEINNGKKYESGQIVLLSGSKGSDIVFCDKIIIQDVKIVFKAKDSEENS